MNPQSSGSSTSHGKFKRYSTLLFRANRLQIQLQNVFWKVAHSDPQDAASFDRLHVLHGGIWGYHLLAEMKIILEKLPRKYAAEIENQ
jgi:hypothetical protein